jgi:hypothetical protein
MAFSSNAKQRKPIKRTTYDMNEKQRDEFYRLLFEQGSDAAREYREQFAETRTIEPTT